MSMERCRGIHGSLRHILAMSLLVILMTGAAAAPAPATTDGDDWMDLWLDFYVRPNYPRIGVSVEEVRQRFQHLYLSLDYDGGGISADDRLIQDQKTAARSRAKELWVLFLHDLDGDGKITRRELERYYALHLRRLAIPPAPIPSQTEQTRRMNFKISQGMKFDRNKDGVVEFDEALDWANENPKPNPNARLRVNHAIPKSLDINSDETISSAEFQGAVNSTIQRYDRESNGEFSKDEIVAINRRAGTIRRAMRDEATARERMEHLKK